MTNKKLFLGMLVMVLAFGTVQALDAQASTFFWREGWEMNNNHNFNTGVFTGPANSFLPYMVEDDADMLNLTQIERELRSMNFSISWVQDTLDNLRNGRHAFIYYISANDLFRWIWITPYN